MPERLGIGIGKGRLPPFPQSGNRARESPLSLGSFAFFSGEKKSYPTFQIQGFGNNWPFSDIVTSPPSLVVIDPETYLVMVPSEVYF